jgi:AraC-like DNA-binding protein
MNFNDYINSFRIEEIKKRFENGETEDFTVLGIALDSGFNSKTTFNRAFKKYTGSTPQFYIQKLKL